MTTFALTGLAWLLAVMVLFGPGASVFWLLLRRSRRHAALRARVGGYSHLPKGVT